MTLSEFTIKLIFLFLPGLLAMIIVKELTNSKKNMDLDFALKSIILGILSYYILSFFKKVNFLDSVLSNSLEIDVNEIFFASLMGIILGVISTALKTYEILHKFARRIRITNKFSESDVWEHILNSPSVYNSWITLRDQKYNLMYEGWVEFYSDSSGKHELFIRDVNVYANISGELQYHVDAIYLNRDIQDLSIEIRELKLNEKENVHERKKTNTRWFNKKRRPKQTSNLTTAPSTTPTTEEKQVISTSHNTPF